MKPLSNAVCVVGVAESDEIGIVKDKSQLTLQIEAIRNAVEDAGLSISDVDGIFTTGGLTTANQHSPAYLAETLGITPRYVDGTSLGGGSYMILVGHAAAALHLGLCDVAVVAHGESGRSQIGIGRSRDKSISAQFEIPYGFAHAPTYFGLVTTRHMHEYGTTLEQWAQVAVSTRAWACLNPKARYRDTITIEDVLKSAPVCYPFNVLNCCVITDGGGAVVLTRADRGKDCTKTPVYVRGIGEAAEHVHLTQMKDLTFSQATHLSSQKALEMAGVSWTEMDHLMLYDNFTSAPPLILESIGIAEHGEGVYFFEEGRSTPGGELPINTNGGGLSYTHTGMYGIFAIIEAVRQLRGECGLRQLRDVSLSLVHGIAGMFSAAGTLVLSNQN